MTQDIYAKVDKVFKSMLTKNKKISSQIGTVIKETLKDKDNFNAIVNMIDQILLAKKKIFFLKNKEGKKPCKGTIVGGYGRSGHFSSIFCNRLDYFGFSAQEARNVGISTRKVGVLVTGSGSTSFVLDTAKAIKEEGGVAFGITYQKDLNKQKHKRTRILSELVGTTELDKTVKLGKFKDFQDRQSKIDQRRNYLIHLRVDKVKEDKALTPMGTLFELSVMYLFEVLVPVITKLKIVKKAHKEVDSTLRREEIIKALVHLRDNRLSKINDIVKDIVNSTLEVNQEPFKNALFALLDTFKRGRFSLGKFAHGLGNKEIHLFSVQGGFAVLEAFNGRLRHLGAPAGSQGRSGNPKELDVLITLISQNRTDAVSNLKSNKNKEPAVITILFAREDNLRYKEAKKFLESTRFKKLDNKNHVHNAFIRVKSEKYNNLVDKHYFVKPFLVEMPTAILLDCIVSMLMSIADISPEDLASSHGAGGGKGTLVN
jgi:hypothetical protein